MQVSPLVCLAVIVQTNLLYVCQSYQGGAAMTVQDVIVVSVPVSDQQRAKDFYVDTLGFEVVRDDSSVPGMRWLQVAPKGGTTALTLVTWFESMPAGSTRGLVLQSDDVHAD